jgi:septal ring factor EnvC (AmiA/AmiB activator)
MRLLREVIRDIRRFPGVTVLSIVTMALTLYISGLFGLIYVNVSGALSSIGERVHMVVFLRDEASPESVDALHGRLTALTGAREVTYMSKEQALAHFRNELGGNASLLDDLEENPLPASFEITFDEDHRAATHLQAVATGLEGDASVEMVDFAKPWTEEFDRVRRLVALVGLVTGSIVVAASILIISFNIRLALASKHEEMSVIHLVGATGFYLSRPYLLEGFLKGVAGGALALLFLTMTRRLVATGFYPVAFFTDAQVALGIFAGGLLGTAGALLSVRSFLKTLLLAAALAIPFAGSPPGLHAQAKDTTGITGDLEKGKENLENIRREIKKNRAEAEKLKSKESSVTGELKHLNKEIDLRGKLLANLGKEITKEEGELGAIVSNLESTRASLARREEILAKRLRSIYERGLPGYLEVLLSSTALPRVGLRLEYLSRVIAYDRKIIEEISRLKSDIEREESEKQSKLQSIQGRKKEADREKRSLESSSQEKKKLLVSVKNEKKKREQMIAELTAQEKSLQSLIQRLEDARLEAEKGGKGKAGPIAGLYGKLPWPVRGEVVTKFGTNYDPVYKTRIPSQGIDIAAGTGTPVKSVEAGSVEYADWWQAYGKMIIVNHGGGYYSLYAHLNDIAVSAGGQVARQQEIGTVGNTGSRADPSLHFEFRRGKEALDPLKWLRAAAH